MNRELPGGIRLTELRRSDQDALTEYLNDRAIYDCTLRIPFPYTAADAEEWFSIVEAAMRHLGEPVHWAIRDPAGKLIGDVGLDGLTVAKSDLGRADPNQPQCVRSHRAEIGYWLARPYWGQGIMSAVVAAVSRHAFDHFGLAKIVANVFSWNAASARVLEKCGFQEEGYFKWHYRKDGRLIDVKAFGLCRPDEPLTTLA